MHDTLRDEDPPRLNEYHPLTQGQRDPKTLSANMILSAKSTDTDDDGDGTGGRKYIDVKVKTWGNGKKEWYASDFQ